MCDDEVEPPVSDFGYEYFPLEVGKYKDYQVDSTLFDGPTIRRFSTTYRREEIVSVGMDLEGEEAYTIHVYKKSNLEDPWVQSGVVVENEIMLEQKDPMKIYALLNWRSQ